MNNVKRTTGRVYTLQKAEKYMMMAMQGRNMSYNVTFITCCNSVFTDRSCTSLSYIMPQWDVWTKICILNHLGSRYYNIYCPFKTEKKKLIFHTQCIDLSVFGNMVLKLGRFGQQIRNTWKVLKYGVGEGWRRSVGPIM